MLVTPGAHLGLKVPGYSASWTPTLPNFEEDRVQKGDAPQVPAETA